MTLHATLSIMLPWRCWSAGHQCTGWPCCSSASLCSWPAPGGATGPQQSAHRSGNEHSRVRSHRRRLLHSTHRLLDGRRREKQAAILMSQRALAEVKNINSRTEIPVGEAFYLKLLRLSIFPPLSLFLNVPCYFGLKTTTWCRSCLVNVTALLTVGLQQLLLGWDGERAVFGRQHHSQADIVLFWGRGPTDQSQQPHRMSLRSRTEALDAKPGGVAQAWRRRKQAFPCRRKRGRGDFSLFKRHKLLLTRFSFGVSKQPKLSEASCYLQLPLHVNLT